MNSQGKHNYPPFSDEAAFKGNFMNKEAMLELINDLTKLKRTPTPHEYTKWRKKAVPVLEELKAETDKSVVVKQEDILFKQRDINKSKFKILPKEEK